MKSHCLPFAGLLVVLLLLSPSLSRAQGSELLVTNIQAVPRPHTTLVDVNYDLETVGGSPAAILLFFSSDGGASYPHRCTAVSGDVGLGVQPGLSRHIVWDAGADFPGFVGAGCRLRVTADDSPYAGEFIYVPPGTFVMGSPPDEPGHDHETQHTVTLTRGFLISRHEMTEEWWTEVMGGEFNWRHPKAFVTWDEAILFCNALSAQEGLDLVYTINGPYGDVSRNPDANGYRLPTEAEWEYACRAGTTTAFYTGPILQTGCDPTDPNLNLAGWYCANAGGSSHHVGLKQANAFGLLDMHGNLWEWCWDWYRHDYEILPAVDPVYEPGGAAGVRVVRGGGWTHYSEHARSACRALWCSPGNKVDHIGFRVTRFLD